MNAHAHKVCVPFRFRSFRRVFQLPRLFDSDSALTPLSKTKDFDFKRSVKHIQVKGTNTYKKTCMCLENCLLGFELPWTCYQHSKHCQANEVVCIMHSY